MSRGLSVAFYVGDQRVVDISRDDAVVATLAAVADVSVRSVERALTDYEALANGERDAVD